MFHPVSCVISVYGLGFRVKVLGLGFCVRLRVIVSITGSVSYLNENFNPSPKHNRSSNPKS